MSEQTASNVPQIRFKGFEGEWEKKTLGCVVSVTTGKLDANAMTGNGIYDFYTSGIKKYKINVAAFIGPAITIAGNGATVGYMHLADGKFNAYQRTYVLNNFTADRSFIFHITGIRLPKKISEEARTGNIPYIVMDMLTELEITIPSSNEQTQIGEYFRELDSLIGLHQRKHDKLVTLKKAMLQKMFPQPGTTTPEIRFKGFAGDWVEKKVDEICDETYGGGTPRTSERKFWEGEIPWIQSSDITDGEIYKVAPRKYISDLALRKSPTKLVPENSIAIVTRVGVGKLALIEFSYATSQDFLSLGKLKIVQSFAVVALSILLQSKLNETQGTSIKGITKDELLAYSFTIPHTIAEQQKIGSYFRTLDALISQHATQLQKLQQIKSACLEKMFV